MVIGKVTGVVVAIVVAWLKPSSLVRPFALSSPSAIVVGGVGDVVTLVLSGLVVAVVVAWPNHRYNQSVSCHK